MHLNLLSSSWQLGAPTGLPFSFESLGGNGGSFLGGCHHVTWARNTSRNRGTRAKCEHVYSSGCGTRQVTGVVWGPRLMNTRGACRVNADPASERGNAHVVFSAAKRQGGDRYRCNTIQLYNCIVQVYNCNTIKCWKQHTLNPEITILSISIF